MLENLFTNLMPVPNFQNIVIKSMLQRSRPQNPSSSELSSLDIPDLEKLTIVDNLQTYMQLVQ